MSHNHKIKEIEEFLDFLDVFYLRLFIHGGAGAEILWEKSRNLAEIQRNIFKSVFIESSLLKLWSDLFSEKI